MLKPSASESSWSDASLDDRDMLLVQNVVLSAVSRMGGPVDGLQWVYQRERHPREQGKPKKGGIGKGVGIALAVGATMVATFVLLEGSY